MNKILQVKMRFSNENNTQRPQARNLKTHAETTTEKIQTLCDNLRSILRFYANSQKFLKNILIDANYNDIIAKSNRIQELLKPVGKKTNDMVVGARFSDAPEGQENHIITYYVEKKTVEDTIEKLESVKDFLKAKSVRHWSRPRRKS